MTGGREHWEQVYAAKGVDQLSWTQASAAPSLYLVERSGLSPDAAFVDVGGGASPLAGELLARGWRDLTVLDIAESGLAAARAQMGADASRVDWVATDVLEWRPAKRFALWHDRAVFHFLTEADDRARYRMTLDAALASGGWLVIAAFAPDGPERCSGLAVQRWSAKGLAEELGPGYTLVESFLEDHPTPGGAMQRFSWAMFRKVGEAAA